MNRLPEIPEGVTALLTVEAEGICAKIRLLLKEAGEWREILSTEGFVGKNGVTDCKREGDGCTPAGLFPLDTAFGAAEDPGSLFPYRKLTEDDYWVDDPESPFYNQLVTFSGREKPVIDTVEGRVQLARAFFCPSCVIFYTPLPEAGLEDEEVYYLDFDGDKTAGNDYMEMLGRLGTREVNGE